MPVEKITITAFRNQQEYIDNVSINAAKTYKIDFSPWIEENSTITNVAWEIKTNQAQISQQAYSAGIASALIAFPQIGTVLIKVTATTANQVCVVWFKIYVKDLSIIDGYFRDYR